ncbi:methyltransferase [Chloroflexi bacterium TSY]|nr:methyltransferase [Chloroflexi bacterium TSY]
MPQTPILSHIQATELLNARTTGQEQYNVSLDLGRSQSTVTLTKQGVVLPGALELGWKRLQKITRNANACFYVVESNRLEKIQLFSEEYNRLYSLMPTTGAPTMLVSGIPMHRIKDTDPWLDTEEKIRAAGPIGGSVLDTATGLGYTATAAAKMADCVTTIELDPVVLDICRANPWSRELFEQPNIEQLFGDSFDVIERLEEARYDHIIHDPPMFSLAGHLYSAEFYSLLFRVLRRGGKLFHYVGNPDSKSGRNVTKGVLERIRSVGFVQIQRKPRAFGIVAVKP